MKYVICQRVQIVDLNDEVLTETIYEHGSLETDSVSVGCSVITPALGLREFQVLYDTRFGTTQKSRIVDIEYLLVEKPVTARVYLEPVTLIVGQHDIGAVTP